MNMIEDFTKKTRWLFLPLPIIGLLYICFDIYTLYIMCTMSNTAVIAISYILFVVVRYLYSKTIDSVTKNIINIYSDLIDVYFTNTMHRITVLKDTNSTTNRNNDLIPTAIIIERGMRNVDNTVSIKFLLSSINHIMIYISMILFITTQLRLIFIL